MHLPLSTFPTMVLLATFCLLLLSSLTPASLASPYSSLACRPDMFHLVPARVQEICSLLAMVQVLTNTAAAGSIEGRVENFFHSTCRA